AMPIEPWLFAQKFVVKILTPRGLIGPSRTAERRQPVVGRGAIRFRVDPNIQIVLASNALLKPFMLVGGVTQNLVENDLQPSGMRLGDQPAEIAQRAEFRMHILVIGNVVTPVAIWRGMDRRQPQRVYV